jgi:acyl-CoA synthetase (AMP-forming)/AMP-acid ligase II
MSLPNGIEFVISFLAVTWLGAAAAPLNPSYTVTFFVVRLPSIYMDLLC